MARSRVGFTRTSLRVGGAVLAAALLTSSGWFVPHPAGAQDKVVDRLFRLYFEEGRDIGERALLIDTAVECGMDGEVVARLFDEGADEAEVRAEIAEAQSLGVTGVPFFIFAQRFGVPGAQSADVLAAAIEQARKSLAGIEAA